MRQRRRNNQITTTAERNPNTHLIKNTFKQTRSIKKRLPKQQQKNSYVGLATDFKERYKQTTRHPFATTTEEMKQNYQIIIDYNLRKRYLVLKNLKTTSLRLLVCSC